MDRKKKSYKSAGHTKGKFRKLKKDMADSYGKSQLKAIEEAMLSPIFILTAGPGTGKKQTVLNGDSFLIAELNESVSRPNDYYG